MLARGNSAASAHLRRAKSTVSVRNSEAAIDLPHVDPETARRDALAAASRAFDRAQARTLTAARSADNLRVNRGNQPHIAKENLNGHPAASCKMPSLRFPDFPPSPDRIEPVPTLESIGIHPRPAPVYRPILRSHELSQDAPTALPVFESPASTLSTSATIRKVRSLFVLRKPPSGSVVVTPSIPNRNPSSNGGPGKSFTSDTPTNVIDLTIDSATEHAQHLPLRRHSYDQDQIIQQAQDNLVQQVEEQRLKTKPSIMGIQRRRSQKAFPKSVRSNAVGRLGTAIASSPAHSAEKLRHRNTILARTRQFSNSLKSIFSGLIHRGQSSSSQIPEQQLEASRAHFNDIESRIVSETLHPRPDSAQDSSTSGPRQPNRPVNIGSVNSYASTWTDSSAHMSSTAGAVTGSYRSRPSRDHQVSGRFGDAGDSSLAWKLMEEQWPTGGNEISRASTQRTVQRVRSDLVSRLPDHVRVGQSPDSTSTYSRSTGGESPVARKSSARTRGHRREKAQMDRDETDSDTLGHFAIRTIERYPEIGPSRTLSTALKGERRHGSGARLDSRLTDRRTSGSNERTHSHSAGQRSMTAAISEETDHDFQIMPDVSEAKRLRSRGHPSLDRLRGDSLASNQTDHAADEVVNIRDPFRDFSSRSGPRTQHDNLHETENSDGDCTNEVEAGASLEEFPFNRSISFRSSRQLRGAYDGVNFSRNQRRDPINYRAPEIKTAYDMNNPQYSSPYANREFSFHSRHGAPDRHLREKRSLRNDFNSAMPDIYKRANDRHSPERERRLTRHQSRGPGGVDENVRNFNLDDSNSPALTNKTNRANDEHTALNDPCAVTHGLAPRRPMRDMYFALENQRLRPRNDRGEESAFI